jgi:hypothetical protein
VRRVAAASDPASDPAAADLSGATARCEVHPPDDMSDGDDLPSACPGGDARLAGATVATTATDPAEGPSAFWAATGGAGFHPHAIRGGGDPSLGVSPDATIDGDPPDSILGCASTGGADPVAAGAGPEAAPGYGGPAAGIAAAPPLTGPASAGPDVAAGAPTLAAAMTPSREGRETRARKAMRLLNASGAVDRFMAVAAAADHAAASLAVAGRATAGTAGQEMQDEPPLSAAADCAEAARAAAAAADREMQDEPDRELRDETALFMAEDLIRYPPPPSL